MSGKVEREKILSQKVMLSLLMAGTMSVCISGGDVWAKTVYVADGSEVSINEDLGGDIIAGQFLNKDGQINCSESQGVEVKSLSGQALQQTANNNLQTHLIFAGTLSSDDEIIGGSYDRIGSGMLTVAGTQIDFSGTAGAITGGGKAASQKDINSSAANSRVSGNTVININGGSISGLVAGGGSAKSNVSDTNTTADVGGNTAIHVSGGELGGLVGGGYAYTYNSVNVRAAARVEGTAAIVINAGQINKIKDTNVAKFNDAAIAGGGLAMSSSTQTSAASVYVGKAQITIAGGTVSGNVYGGGLAVNAGSSAIAGSTQVTIAGGKINGQKIYGGGSAVGAGSEAVTGNTSLILTAADTGIDCIYGGGYAVEGGKVTTGNTHIVIDIAGNGKGAEDIFGGNSVYAFPGGTNVQGIVGDTLIEYKNGTSRGMVFGGSEIMGYTSATNDISKVESGNTAIFVTGGILTEAVLGGSKVRLTGDQANKISSTGKDTTVIVSGASVKGLVGGDLVQVLKKTYDKPVRIAEGSVEKTNIIVNGGTVGTLYVDAGASIQIGDAGFKGAIIGGGVATGGTDENKHALSSVDTANVVINDGIVNGDVYGGGLSTATLRSGNEADGGISTVASSNVTINGGIVNGDIYGGGAAVGAGTYDGGSSSVQNAVVNISGGTVNGSVYAGGYTSGSSAESKITNAATVNLTAGNVTGSINGSKDIVAGLSKLKVSNYQGNVGTIKNFNEIELTNSDFSSDLVLNGSTARTSGQVTLRGQLEILSAGVQNTLLAQGRQFGVIQNEDGSAAVYLESGSENEEHNNLFFNAKTTEIITDAKDYVAGIQVNSKQQAGGLSSNKLEFNGDNVKIDVSASEGKAAGLKISHSDNGGTLNTEFVFNSAVTEIRAHGNVSNAYYDQVAGIWEGEGSFKADSTTAVTFTGTANIEAASSIVGAYGVYLNGDGGTSTIDFQGDTNIQAYNGQTLGTAVYVDGEKRSVKLGSAGKLVDLTGDVIAKNSGEVILRGNRNVITGTLKSDSGKIILQGDSYDIDKFVTTNGGKIIVSSGTLNIDNIITSDLKDDNSLIVSGKGVLQATSGTVFAGDSIKDAIKNKIEFNSGKLMISDATYTLQQSTGYSKALKQAAEQDNGNTMLVLTGTLVDGTGNAVTEAKADDLADTGVIHSAVTGQVADNGAVAVGNKDFGVKDLALGTGNNSVTISGDGTSGALTLVGSSSAGTELVKTSSAAADVKVEIKDGATLNLGVAGSDSGGKLTGSVNISDANSKINVDAGTFEITKVEASLGTVAINSGAVLKTDKMEVGTAVANINGAAEVKELKAAAGSAINVGTGDSAGSLVAGNAELHGAAVVLDPVWQGNDTIGQASKAALTFINNSVDGLMTVGRNSVLSLGTDDTAKAETAFSETGLTWGENGVSAALYIDRAQQLAASGGLYIDGNKDAAAAEANKANFAAGSLLIVNGAGIGTSGAAALTGSADSKLTVADGARLYLTSTNAGTYVITDNFTNSSSITGWSADAAKAEVSVNKLSEIEKVEQDAANGKYTVTVKQKDVQKTYDGISLPHILQAMDQSKTEYAGIKYLTELANDTGLSPSEFVAAVNDFARGAESSGTSRSSALAAAEIGNAVQEHLSFANLGGEISAGLGRGEDQAESGNIWAQYLHNKDKVNDLGGVSYDAQYNGVVIGGDFAPRGKYSSGVAFSYGSGSSTGSASKNEFDFWGLSYYGSVRNADTNLIFDAGYSKTSSEFKGVVKAEPSAQVFTLGIKGEQSYDGGHGTRFVPYAGLRYLHIDADAYTGTIGGSAAARYSPDKADVWLLPLGINISHVSSGADGWLLRPSIDLAYVWALGDRDNLMSVTVPGVDAGDRVGYELMEKGFFAGRLGLEAAKDDWSYGVSYSYQKGSAAQSSKWFVNVQYSF